jgi:hypothetical protein
MEYWHSLRIMDTPLKVLKLNFCLGNADCDRGTLRKYWNRNTKMSTINVKVDFKTWITFEILWGNGILASLRIMDTHLKVLNFNFRLGNADFDRGTLRKYWNRNTKMSKKNDESRFSNIKNFWNPIG